MPYSITCMVRDLAVRKPLDFDDGVERVTLVSGEAGVGCMGSIS